MKTFAFIVVWFASAAAWAAPERFDAVAEGSLPAGWITAGRGDPRWSVEKDESAPSPLNVLRQSGRAIYPLCLKTESWVRDGFVEVKFKPAGGRQDQSAGVVWRAEDVDNYYVCRADALKGTVAFFKVLDGQRIPLEVVSLRGSFGIKAVVPKQAWSTLRVEFSKSRFVAYLNGTRLIEVDDFSFADPGMVGLWTKADSVTLFDDFDFGGVE